ncbi:MAG TPA: type II secretion system F family protein [Acidimicrobiales bacterium]|nr:type II secretion system F family protein [Acidimicrobiales bacterium]
MSAGSADRRPRTRLLAGLAASFLACLVVAAGPAVLGQESDGQLARLSVRKVDASDPEAVRTSFIWNGERRALEDLVVRQGGREVEHSPPVPLATAGVETAIVVAVDTSRSMARNGGVAAVQDTLRTLVDDLEGNEAMGLVTFETEVRVLSPITTDKEDLGDAIGRISAPADGDTALWGGLRRAASLFEPDSELQPNIVLVTDGYNDQDTTEAQATSAVTTSGAAVFALAYDAQQHVDSDAIASVVASAGGAIIPAPGPEDLQAGLEQVKQALANQYVVTFAGGGEQGATDLEISVGNESVRTTYVPGAVSQGQANLAPPTVSRSLMPDILRGDVGLIIVVAAGGLAVALAVVAVAALTSKDESSLDTMLQQYTEPGPAALEGDEGYAQTAFIQRAVELTGEIADKQGILVKVEAKLEQADLPLRAAEALFFYGAGALVVTLLGFPVMGLIGLLVFGGIGFLVPLAVLSFLGRRRHKKFNSQLPDMLQLLSGSLRAGYSLVQGVDAVANESDGPMGRELRRAMTEARLGRELEDALQAAAMRVQSKDFEWAIMAIGIQREVGGNLSELLMTVSDTMIGRERLRRDVASLTAEGKMSAIILGIMPIALGLIMYVMNPSYMEPLFSQSLGHILLGVAALTMGIGFVWMKKCITIEI